MEELLNPISIAVFILLIVFVVVMNILAFKESKKFNPHSTSSRTEALKMEEETVEKLKHNENKRR